MRIKLKNCDRYIFSTSIKVRVTDLNYGNHLGNDKILAYAQEARADFLASLGYGELTMAGKGIIMTDTAIVYKSEAHGGDLLTIELAIDDLTTVGFDFYYKISNSATQKEVAMVKTGILCFDYSTRKIAPLPQEVRDKFNQLLA